MIFTAIREMSNWRKYQTYKISLRQESFNWYLILLIKERMPKLLNEIYFEKTFKFYGAPA